MRPSAELARLLDGLRPACSTASTATDALASGHLWSFGTVKPLVPDFRTGEYAAIYRTLDAQAKGLLQGDEAAAPD